ncbi:MAG: 2Fe-2S iron-sulfur cluster binding domain-containing protein [Bdellovibrio sp.]|nr:2Fe-2S iron-sulfur cluster binding domain-containing protein [Bdellovibrio sp.]
MPKITLNQRNLTFDTPAGENLMQYLQAQGIPVASSCLGDGICGKCRVRVTGKLPKASALEKTTLSRNQATDAERLACQMITENDLEISTSYW